MHALHHGTSGLVFCSTLKGKKQRFLHWKPAIAQAHGDSLHIKPSGRVCVGQCCIFSAVYWHVFPQPRSELQVMVSEIKKTELQPMYFGPTLTQALELFKTTSNMGKHKRQ